MWAIIIVGVLFGGRADTGMTFISHDACKAVVSHMQTDVGKPVCEPIK